MVNSLIDVEDILVQVFVFYDYSSATYFAQITQDFTIREPFCTSLKNIFWNKHSSLLCFTLNGKEKRFAIQRQENQ
jgi:hypothetical protein